MDRAMDNYKTALAKGVPYENIVLPQGVQTSLVVSGNFRAWFEYLGKRLCNRAMPEHRQLARDYSYNYYLKYLRSSIEILRTVRTVRKRGVHSMVKGMKLNPDESHVRKYRTN